MALSPLLAMLLTDPNQTEKVVNINQDLLDVEAGALGSLGVIHMADADQSPTGNALKFFVLAAADALTAARNVKLPTAGRVYYFVNATTGGWPITVKTTGGTGVSIPPGGEAWVRCDGTNIVLMKALQGLSMESTDPTYSYVLRAVSFYSPATDLVGIIGSATKAVYIKRIKIVGRAQNISELDFKLIRRSAANTGGTPTALTASKSDSSDPAATATVNLYTVAPSLGAFDSVKRVEQIILPPIGLQGPASSIEWKFGDVGEKAMILRGIAQQASISVEDDTHTAVAIPTGAVFDVFIDTKEL